MLSPEALFLPHNAEQTARVTALPLPPSWGPLEGGGEQLREGVWEEGM